MRGPDAVRAALAFGPADPMYKFGFWISDCGMESRKKTCASRDRMESEVRGQAGCLIAESGWEPNLQKLR